MGSEFLVLMPTIARAIFVCKHAEYEEREDNYHYAKSDKPYERAADQKKIQHTYTILATAMMLGFTASFVVL